MSISGSCNPPPPLPKNTMCSVSSNSNQALSLTAFTSDSFTRPRTSSDTDSNSSWLTSTKSPLSARRQPLNATGSSAKGGPQNIKRICCKKKLFYFIFLPKNHVPIILVSKQLKIKHFKTNCSANSCSKCTNCQHLFFPPFFLNILVAFKKKYY